ncbi:hypothetical protein [Absidia glauca]|uniref:Mid2 domain-containing protein n=1 Tax=Absidia glauca TaxID=4829 RepID=A0A163KCH2_ABSGL|nr:hypothetical protein [Absidia glauca]
MTRSLPLLAILLFLLQLSLVHSLDSNTNRQRKRNLIPPSATPRLIAREDYSSFNQTTAVPEMDHHKKNSSSNRSSRTTKTDNPPPSVTTIIIIQSNGQTYHELGGGPSTTTPNSNGGGNGMEDPNESSIEAQVDQDNAVLKRLITISTVVGGVGIAMIIGGTIIYLRLRSKRRRRRQLKAMRHDDEQPPSPRLHDDTGTDEPPPSSPTPPASSSPDEAQRQPLGTEAIEMSLIIPSAPPEPTLLPAHLRQRHQQSMLLQQDSTPAPSAPSAKELEMNLPSSLTYQHQHSNNSPLSPSTPSSSPSSSSSSSYHSNQVSICISPPSPSKQDHHQLLHSTQTATSSTSSPPSLSRPHNLHLKPTAGPTGSDSSSSRPADISTSDQTHQPPLTPDLPPPAYTPSAPPLFILPPSQRRRGGVTHPSQKEWHLILHYGPERTDFETPSGSKPFGLRLFGALAICHPTGFQTPLLATKCHFYH